MENNHQLEDDLRQFSGTDTWHKWSVFYPNYVVTDGVKYLADQAKAYWLLDVIGSWNLTTPRVRREDFQVWRMTTDLSTGIAQVVADDGCGHVIARQTISSTTFPLQEIKLYAEYAGEHLAICLPWER